MNELLSVIKLKDKITIISLMVAFAVVLAVSIGVITSATVDVHKHSYAYHIERVDADSFAVVGVCTDKTCEDPRASWAISSFSDISVTSPTCCAPGNIRYILTTDVLEGEYKTYILDEPVAQLPHNYKGGVMISDDGTALVDVDCTNEGCTSTELKVDNMDVSSLKLLESKAATCHSDRYEKYSYTKNGITSTIESYIKEDVPHTLNGKYASEYEIAGFYLYGTEGITLVGGDSLACGQTAKGSYVCEVCEKTQTVDVAKNPHTFKYDDSKTVLPNTMGTGKAVVACTACGETVSILLPKIVVGSNSEIISSDVDKETQTVKYIYSDNNYNFTVEAEIVIPWDNHVLGYTEEDIVYPTLTGDGYVTLRCQNSVCSKEVKVVLPAMTVGGNTQLVSYHILEKQTYTYHFVSSDYDFVDITYSYDVPWSDHTYVYSAGETVDPTLESDGKAYVRCSYEGCDKYHEITIPKIVLSNTKPISSATESALAVVRYTYDNKDYGFTVIVDLSVGDYLPHNYKYKLELNIFTGNFDFVGKCNQPGCKTPETRVENVPVEMEETFATCTTDGHLVVRYTDGESGKTYEITVPNGSRTGHNYVATSKVEPTFSKDGSVTIACANEGCTEEAVELVLPKMFFGTNTQIISDVSEVSAAIARYTYTNDDYNYVLLIDFTIGSPLDHEYSYEIRVNGQGGYDLVGQCNQPGCQTPEIYEENIDAIVEEHKADCTNDGYVYVKYVNDEGVVFEATIPTDAKTGHKYDVDAPISKTNPTWEKEGSATLKCTNDGCEHTTVVVLPKIEHGVTAFNLDDSQLYYIYTDKETGYEIFFLL